MSAPVVFPTGDPESPLGDIGKIVTVDALGTPGVNCDYTTIKDACAYLKSLPGNIGGIIALRGNQVHIVDTVVDGQGITFQSGRFSPQPVIRAATGGRLIANGASFRSVVIDVPIAFAGLFLLDFDANSFADFLNCDFTPATGKSIFGNSGAAVTIHITFRECSQSIAIGNGVMVDPASAFTTPVFEVLGTNGGPFLQFDDEDVSVNADGRMDTTGHITGLPESRLFVAVGENIQSRLESIATDGMGGIVYVLPGTHTTTKPVEILGDDITLEGFGGGSIIYADAATWDYVNYPSNQVNYNAVVRIGQYKNDIVVNGCSISSIHIRQSVFQHGVHVYGGSNNTVMGVTAEALDALSWGAGAWACVGILCTDSQNARGSRLVIDGCTVTSDNYSAHYYCDCFHLDGGNISPFTGVYGFGNGIYDSSIINSIAYSALETVFELSSAFGCVCYLAQGRNVPYMASGIVIGIIGCLNSTFLGVSCIITPLSGANGVWLYGSTGCTIEDCFIDGGANTFTAGLQIQSGSSKNIITGNVFSRCITAITIDGGCTGNILEPNQYISCGTIITDAGGNYYVSKSSLGSGPPGALVGMFGDGYFDGTHWWKQATYPVGAGWVMLL